jgi:ferric-dicitrate binding protein FerR (iron transport regulator)
LTFNGTPLRDAARDVSRMFDVDVTIADSTLDSMLVTGSFANQPVDEVLRSITYVIGAHYERTGRAVVIRRGVMPVGRSRADPSATLRMTQARPDR